MESYLPTSDRYAASWIFSDGPSKPLGVVKLCYNALKLFFYNVAILRQLTCLFPPATLISGSFSCGKTASTSVDCIGDGSYDIRSRKLQGMFAHELS